jgi:hypothetical protein
VSICDHSGLDETFCDHCRNAGKPRQSVMTARIPGRIEARYRGVCRGCGLPFTPGTLLTPSDTDGWIAECCAPEDGDC